MAESALEPTVATAANECLQSFQRCFDSSTAIHPRDLSRVEDQLARFSTWAESIGVFAHGRASMDHRLRKAQEVQRVVIGLLESLDSRIRACSQIIQTESRPSEKSTNDEPRERLDRTLLDVAAEITRLNKISNTIRKASAEVKSSEARNFHLQDDDGNDVEALLSSHYERYIGDRFPNISQTIQQRLARAMILRRKRVLYRRARHGNNTSLPKRVTSELPIRFPPSRQPDEKAWTDQLPEQDETQTHAREALSITPSKVQSATTLDPERYRQASSSITKISESKTVALNYHEPIAFPPPPDLTAKKQYEKVKKARMADFHTAIEKGEPRTEAESKLKELLQSDLKAIGEITCPYCLYSLPAQEIFDERSWRQHVKNDLDPYVCLFDECEQPDMLYSHSHEWSSHLHQHGKHWRCTSHRELGPFSTSAEFIQHVKEVHQTRLNDRQLHSLASRNVQRPTELFSSCPLCGKELFECGNRLEDHIVGHLRALALKSLPIYLEDNSDGFQSAAETSGASQAQSRSTLSDFGDEANVDWTEWNESQATHHPIGDVGEINLALSATESLSLQEYAEEVRMLLLDRSLARYGHLDQDPTFQQMLHKRLELGIKHKRAVVSHINMKSTEKESSADYNESSAVVSNSPPKIRVLFVDKSPADTDALSRMLHSEHVSHAVPAKDGEEAFNLVREAAKPFDIILIDLDSSVIDGLLFTRKLRLSGSTLPIVGITSFSTKDSEYFRPGVSEVLERPISHAALQPILQRARLKNGGTTGASTISSSFNNGDSKFERDIHTLAAISRLSSPGPFSRNFPGRATFTKPKNLTGYAQSASADHPFLCRACWKSFDTSVSFEKHNLEGSCQLPGEEPFVSWNNSLCPREEASLDFTEWFTFPNTISNSLSSKICNNCYRNYFAPPFTNCNNMVRVREVQSSPIACHFGSLHWFRIAWLCTVKKGQKDLTHFWDIIMEYLSLETKPCPGDQMVSMPWFLFKTSESCQDDFDKFTVCQRCAKTIMKTFPTLDGALVCKDDRAFNNFSSLCSLRYTPTRERFIIYLDELEKYEDDTSRLGKRPDIDALASRMRTIRNRPECSGYAVLRNQRWHIMQSLPDFTVCEDCFDSVVQPHYVDSIVAQFFLKDPQERPLASCTLYSNRMRKIFWAACLTDDLNFLKDQFFERYRAEKEFRRKMSDLHSSVERLDEKAAAEVMAEWARCE